MSDRTGSVDNLFPRSLTQKSTFAYVFILYKNKILKHTYLIFVVGKRKGPGGGLLNKVLNGEAPP